ncbi:unnamed protein product [Bursaphelenchus xylophilus]|uniref:(pine wood nematode) hypothetical protein n=1 Tax=Bursaphelenchus xylophilus TaxID=6326 RepID=A0A1I7SDX1_BURXY|nr:unnamed protein product [Bursaphelenchus xylophilus]CAG9100342.1 unnamed protein product [Bursaphelenchus xylophilus]
MGLTEKVEKLAVKARYCPVPGGFNSRCYHSRFWESAVRKDRLLTSLLGVALVISFSATVLETVVYAVEGDVWRINISLLVYTAFSALLLLYLTTAFILKQVVLAMQGIDSGIIAKHDPTLVQVLRENRAVWADSGLSHREILTRLYCYQPFDTELEDVIDAPLSSRLQDVLPFSVSLRSPLFIARPPQKGTHFFSEDHFPTPHKCVRIFSIRSRGVSLSSNGETKERMVVPAHCTLWKVPGPAAERVHDSDRAFPDVLRGASRILRGSSEDGDWLTKRAMRSKDGARVSVDEGFSSCQSDA